MYNLTSYDNATDMLDFFKASNNLASGFLFSLFFMFVLFFVLFIAFKTKYDTIVAFIGSSFIVGVIGVGGWSLGLVPTNIVFIPIFMLIASIITYLLTD